MSTRTQSEKRCCKCGESKPLSEFGKRSRTPDGLHYGCRPCMAAESRAHYTADPEARRRRQRELRAAHSAEAKARRHRKGQARRYGISLEEYEAMLAAADGAPCPICETTMVAGGPASARPCFDHCHASGRLRRVICGSCNTGLGMFRDSPDALRRAAAYLESW